MYAGQKIVAFYIKPKKGLPLQRVQVSFFSMPTPALTGSGDKVMISAIVYLAIQF
jgi:hypothetical protein